jgi:hypothetical protein
MVFEFISLIMSVIAVIGLIYYSFIFKRFSGLKEQGANILKIKFNASIEQTIFSDVKITISSYKNDNDNETEAYIIYSKELEEKNETDLIQKINNEYPSNIFLFNSNRTAELFLHHLQSIKLNANLLNSTVLLLILFFLIFIKITLMKITLKQIKSVKTSKIGGKGKDTLADNILAELNQPELSEQKQIFFNPTLSFLNPIMVYYYFIFHLTVILILPLIIPNFLAYKVSTYFGFNPNLFYSIYYHRSNIGQINIHNLNYTKLKTFESPSEDSFLFLFHPSLNLAYEENKGSSNPYVINLCFMCCCIWISQYFKPFDQGRNVKIEDRNITKSNKKKMLNYLVTCSLFIVWIFFLIWGVLHTFDYLYLFHKLLFYNFKKVADLRISICICLFYIHIYFYVIMIMHTIEFKNKNKNYKGPLLKDFSFLSHK